MSGAGRLLLLLLSTGGAACAPSATEAPPRSAAEPFVVPSGFPTPSFEASNPLAPERAALGALLFFEPGLSRNGTVSCATCHVPRLGFADGEITSVGVSGRPLVRHTPALFNLAWADNGLFWDGGAKNLESLAFGPLTNEDEMGADLREVAAFLANDDLYRTAFELAFEQPFEIGQVGMALAQYVRTLVSADSPYDRAEEGGRPLSERERRGQALVERHCASCHAGVLFTDHGYWNNGLEAAFSDEDEGVHLGRARVSFSPEDLGKWRTPTLRNVALTAPYMHDGRFSTLTEVLDHYRNGIVMSSTLAPQLRGGIPLSDRDVEDVLAFLHALSGAHALERAIVPAD